MSESTKEEGPGITLILENLNEEAIKMVAREKALPQLVSIIASSLRDSDYSCTRVVVTGDLVRSVNSRENRNDNKYTMERGGGTVAAKTMPPNTDGIVDILVPAHWLLPLENEESSLERDQYIQHVAAHEAIHARLFNDGGEPFDVYRRRKYGDALMQFMSMAGHQVEEHLAEYLSNQTTSAPWTTTREQLSASFEAWNRTLSKKLPAISNIEPDYYQKGMMITLTALHDLWKVLSYYAAELRINDSFQSVPKDVAELVEWKEEVSSWWDEYTSLLSQIPMSTPVDIPATDEVMEKIGRLLQRWAKGIGVDYHDTAEGSWFQLKRGI